VRAAGHKENCDLVFIVVYDEKKNEVLISRLDLNGTGSCCLANTIVAILPARIRNSSRWKGRRYISDETRDVGHARIWHRAW
jgi:hypothetical protein